MIGALSFVSVLAVAGLILIIILLAGNRSATEGTVSAPSGPPVGEEPEASPPPGTQPDPPVGEVAENSSPPGTQSDPIGTTEPDIDDTTAPVPTPSELARSVVQIQLLLDGQITCSGSGTIIESDGTILTNSHVIAQTPFCPHDTIGVAVLDTPERPPVLTYEAEVLADDPALDLAVIRISVSLAGDPVLPEFPVIELGDSDRLELGDRLNVIGYPGIGGETVTFTEGIISGFVSSPGLGERSWLKTDATLAGGNSGGLATDLTGQLVGIPTIVGTGDGAITDCRFVADTNGDGVIDQNDACVPVGGFINGVRPVNLARPLITQARQASPMPRPEPMVDQVVELVPEVTDPVWTLEHDDGFPLAPTVLPPTGAPQLCLVWQFDNVPAGSSFDVVWFHEGESQPGAAVSGTTTAGPSGGFFACITDALGLGPGTYEVGWLIDDIPVFSEAIYLGSDRTEIVLEIVNNTETALCIVQFSPTLAITFGINRLDAPLPPGRSTVIRLASGVYDRRVFDCDGALLDEDFGGAELVADSRFTLTAN